MIGLLFKHLFRTKALIIGIAVLFAVGVLSIHIGKVFIDRQGQIMELTDQAQKEHIERHVGYIDGHIGLLMYYIKFGFANDLSTLAGLSIGQKDIRQAAQLVNIRNLEEQKNTAELLNPFFQLLGNLDFSFVLIYLFPLIIIALCFNLWSEEKESGRWSLLSVQTHRAKGIILWKLLIRFFIILLVLLSLLLLATFYLDITMDSALFSFVVISVLYICFWFSLAWYIVNLGKPSKQNAIILLSSWLFLTIVLPALTNTAVSTLYPIPEAYETTIDSRDGYHTKWDQPKEPTIERFKRQYPQYEQYTHPENESFSWFWYYAMQHMGDMEAQNARQAMKEKLHKRNRLTRWMGYFIPSIHTQLSMNSLSKTDMTNYLKYMDALESFHEDLRLSFYEDIFEATAIIDKNWNDHNLAYYTDQRAISIVLFLPLILISLILLAFSLLSFIKRDNI